MASFIRRIIGFGLIAGGSGYLLYDAYMRLSWILLLWPLSSITFQPTFAILAPYVLSIAGIFIGVYVLRRGKPSNRSRS